MSNAPRNQEERDLCDAVDVFSARMKVKLIDKARSGFHGWKSADPNYIAQLLAKHLNKGDPVDIANFCMMLDQQKRGFSMRPFAPERSEDEWSGRITYAVER